MVKKIKNIIRSKKFELFVLFIVLVGAFGVRLYKIQNPIADWHSWRQVDTASVSRIYVQNGIDLLKPRYYDISVLQTGYQNTNGYRFVEFPIYNLIHVVLYQNFPQLDFVVWGRLVSVMAAMLTAGSLYYIGKNLFNKWIGLLSAFFYSFIPFNIYFTRVILPDPLAVAFAVLSVCLFVEYVQKEKRLMLFASAVSFSFAMLVKPTAFFYAVPITYLAVRKFGILGIFKNKSLLLSLDIALIPVFLWRAWMNQKQYLVGIPYNQWLFNGDGIRFRPAYFRWIYGERLGRLILGIWGLIPVSYGLFVVSKVKKYKYFSQAFLFGAFLFVTIFATANVRHDYYQVFVVPPVALILGIGVYTYWQSAIGHKLLTRLFLIFSIGMMFLMGYDLVKGDYNINHYEIVTAGEAANKLLPKDAKVIAPYNGDTAFLYHTQRFGWPIVDRSIDEMIDLGADYYVSVNTGDTDSVNFKKMFKTVEETGDYIILDLHERIELEE